MKNIWELCEGKKHISSLKINGIRIVEDQESSTRRLVDNGQKHEILKELIEENKPKISSELKKFFTLPLEHGSRFGTRFDQKLFYASLDLKTAMAEKAFYRMSFIRASHSLQGGMPISMTSFQVNINTNLGVDLTKSPFLEYKADISSPISYQISQPLGQTMRDHSVEAFIYFSARSRENAKNVAVISQKIFKEPQEIEKTFKSWSCFPTKDTVEFSRKLSETKEYFVFNESDFLYKGIFPSIPISS